MIHGASSTDAQSQRNHGGCTATNLGDQGECAGRVWPTSRANEAHDDKIKCPDHGVRCPAAQVHVSVWPCDGHTCRGRRHHLTFPPPTSTTSPSYSATQPPLLVTKRHGLASTTTTPESPSTNYASPRSKTIRGAFLRREALSSHPRARLLPPSVSSPHTSTSATR